MAVLEALFGISVRIMAETERKGEERIVKERLEQCNQKPVVVVNTDGEREQWQVRNISSATPSRLAAVSPNINSVYTRIL